MQKTAGRTLAGIVAAVAAAFLRAPDANAGTLSSPGCLAGGEAATVSTVDADLDLHLTDGRIVRLAGIHAAAADRPGAAGTPPGDLAAWLTHASVSVAPLRAEPDRWGRTVALVFAPGTAEAGGLVSVGEALLDAGLATAAPEPDVAPCWTTYLQLEDAARQARSGLWARGDAIVAPSDRAALARQLGAWTLVEGQVGAVRDGHARTYVRFNDDGGSGLAIAIDHATTRRLARTLGDTTGWTGRRLLARGLLDDRWGLQIDVSSPEQITLAPP